MCPLKHLHARFLLCPSAAVPQVNFFDGRATGAVEPLLNGGAGFSVQPGASFSTECSYAVGDGSRFRRGRSSVSFGYAEGKETCVDYLYYYPRVHVQACGPLRPTAKMVKMGRVSAAVFLPPAAQHDVQPGGEGGCHGRFSKLTRLDQLTDIRRTWGVREQHHFTDRAPLMS